jgi:hypothetical protein
MKKSPVATGKVVVKKAAVKKKAAKKKLSTIGRLKAIALIKANGPAKIFSVTVDTKKTLGRVLTGRLTKPAKKVKGTKTKAVVVPDLSPLGMIRIYDMVDHGWKTANMQTMSGLRVGGKAYNVK